MNNPFNACLHFQPLDATTMQSCIAVGDVFVHKRGIDGQCNRFAKLYSGGHNKSEKETKPGGFSTNWREKGPKYGRQLNCGHESQLKGPPKNAITTQLQKVRGQRHKNVSGYFFSFIT